MKNLYRGFDVRSSLKEPCQPPLVMTIELSGIPDNREITAEVCNRIRKNGDPTEL
jgi:hypothetical protein